MKNNMTTDLNKINCLLIKSFGDGHNHELRQYQELCLRLEEMSLSALKGSHLLGNVMCGSVSLDSLLLTPFGVYIVEFKCYEDIHTIRINGQKDFLCLNSVGTSVKDKDGKPLTVKGGSMPSPYEQARVNRCAVRDSLRKCFGDDVAKCLHIGVVIFFKGNVRIEGLDVLSDHDREWLTVVNSGNITNFVSYMAEERKKGITLEMQEQLMSHMDANQDVLQPISIYEQAKNLLDMKKYAEAYKLLKKCDPLRPEVISKILLALFFLNASDEFSYSVSKALGSNSADVRESAYLLLGLSYYEGKCGYSKDKDKALEYLTKVSNKSTVALSRIEKIKEEKAASEREWIMKSRRNTSRENLHLLLHNASEGYENVGRIVSTILFLLPFIFGISILLPEMKMHWYSVGTLMTVLTVAVMSFCGWKWMEGGGHNCWYVRTSPEPHIGELKFRTIDVDKMDFFQSNRWYKSLFCGVLFMAFQIIPFVIGYRLLCNFIGWVSSTRYGASLNDFIQAHSSVDMLSCIPWFVMLYFLLNIIGYAYSLVRQLVGECKVMYPDDYSKEPYYSIAVPNMWVDRRPPFKSSLIICKRSALFGVGMATLLSVLGAVKPLVYQLIL